MDITPTQGFPQMYDYIGDTVAKTASPLALSVFLLVILLYYVLFSYLGGGRGPAVSGAGAPGITFIEIVMWGLFIFLILINGLQYFFEINIKAALSNLFTPVPQVDLTITTPPEAGEIDEGELPSERDRAEDRAEEEAAGGRRGRSAPPQVFHITDNTYTYDDGRAMCKAFGGRLADYSEVEEAYRQGAEWCGYGWSKDQMALYPTQMRTWEELQQIKGHEHDCGRPGINGGFIGNKDANYGVNCYGRKPGITELDTKMMERNGPFPSTIEESEFEERVSKYRTQLPDVMVSPFNYQRWSQI